MPKLVHVTTVPDALIFFRGRLGFMRARGYDLLVVSPPGARLDDFGRAEGIPVAGVPMTRRITPLRDLGALAALARLFHRERPDIVHAHTPKGGLLAVTAAWLAGVPVRIYHLHGLPLVTATGVRRQILRVTERIAAAAATRVLSVSHSLRQCVVAEGLVPADKIQVLLNGSVNGVDALGRFDPARMGSDARERVRATLGIRRDATVFVFVGRLVRDKGVVELADAWEGVKERVPGARLLLVGLPESEDPVSKDVLARLEADPTVSMLGFVEETPPIYAAGDVVVLPTYREGLPNVPLEAAAMGRPVVATRVVGSVDAVLDGVTGTLVEPGDASALADAMIAYAARPDLAEKHGRAGRRRAIQEFSPERIWLELAAFYECSLGRRTPSPQEYPRVDGAALSAS